MIAPRRGTRGRGAEGRRKGEGDAARDVGFEGPLASAGT